MEDNDIVELFLARNEDAIWIRYMSSIWLIHVKAHICMRYTLFTKKSQTGKIKTGTFR